jgi:hypothetical protein
MSEMTAEELKTAAAAILGMDTAALLVRDEGMGAFRRACAAFLMRATGLPRKPIAEAFGLTEQGIDAAVKLVRDRMTQSEIFARKMGRMVDLIRVSSRTVARFNEIQRAFRPEFTSRDALATTAAMLTLAEALAPGEAANAE